MAKPNRYKVSVWCSSNSQPVTHILDAWSAADAGYQALLRYRHDNNAYVQDVTPVGSFGFEEPLPKGHPINVTIPTNGSLITEETIKEVVRKVNAEAEAARAKEAKEKQQKADLTNAFNDFLRKDLETVEVFKMEQFVNSQPYPSTWEYGPKVFRPITQCTIAGLIRTKNGKTWHVEFKEQ